MAPSWGGASSGRHGGGGLATEAAFAARDDAFTRVGLPEISSIIQPYNERSQRVAVTLGMARSRQIEDPVIGRDVDVWRLTAEDLRSLVGRTTELGQLASARRRALVVVTSGLAGVGKSRFAGERSRRLNGAGTIQIAERLVLSVLSPESHLCPREAETRLQVTQRTPDRARRDDRRLRWMADPALMPTGLPSGERARRAAKGRHAVGRRRCCGWVSRRQP